MAVVVVFVLVMAAMMAGITPSHKSGNGAYSDHSEDHCCSDSIGDPLSRYTWI
jgi:hypothetical protein